MNVSMTRRQHVTASYGILAAAALVVLFAVLRAPIAGRIEFAAELDQQRTTYAKSLSALARSESTRAAVDERRATTDVDAQLYHSDTAALAGAELQNELQRLIEAEGGMLMSSAFRQPTEPAPLTPVSVSVRLHCSIESLMRILHGLEARQPVLFVENVAVQSRYRIGQRVRDAVDELDVEFDVIGYLDRRFDK